MDLKWPEIGRKWTKITKFHRAILNFTNLACFLQRSNPLYRSNLHVSNFWNFFLLEFFPNIILGIFFPNQLNLNSLHDWVFHQNNSSCTQWHSPRLISLLSSLLLWCWVDSLVSTFRLDAVRLDYNSSVLIGLIDFTIFYRFFSVGSRISNSIIFEWSRSTHFKFELINRDIWNLI